MLDILYPLSICGPLVVVTKRNFHLVALNESGRAIKPLTPLEEIGYVGQDGVNRLTGVKGYSGSQFAHQKRKADQRDLREVQDARLSLELEQYLHGVERAFPVDELSPAWYPVRMLADLLRHHAEYALPDFDLVQITTELITHSDYLIRRNLADSDIRLPAATLRVDANSPNPAVPAVRLALTYFEQMLDAYSHAQTEVVARCVSRLMEA